ncbi:AAA family ATPase [Kutzneria sp. NPDC051319]|uniref:helix-turn-helix transcriptional regulator n=1 Tax=Kutzneria sp. NPDC051319 TaxID=3155047 RepID=UPI003447D4C9
MVSHVRVGSPRFIGRREELDAAREFTEHVRRSGRGGVLLISGAAGVGKSRLLAEICDGHVASGGVALRGACPPVGDYPIPYAPIVEALHGHVAELLSPPGRELRLDPQARSELFEHVASVLVDAAPVLLGLDDLHWADPSTVSLLGFLSVRLRATPVVLVCVYRDDELDAGHPTRRLLAELVRHDQAATVALHGLTLRETGEQVLDLLGRTPGPVVVRRIFERSQGNPFLTEVLAGMDPPGHGDVPPSVADLVLRHAHQLSESALSALRIAAVAGPTISDDLFAALWEDHAAVRECVRCHLLVRTDGGYRFRHGLIAEAMYADLLPAERRRIHATLAELLSSNPQWADDAPAGAAAQIARHWHAAGDRPRALTAAVHAAFAAAEVHAHEETLRHLEHAVALWPEVPDADQLVGLDCGHLLQQAALYADRLGDGKRAIELMRTAIAHVPSVREPERILRMCLLLSDYHLCESQESEAVATLDLAEQLLPSDPPAAWLAELAASRAWLAVRRDQPADARRLGAEAITLGRAGGVWQAEQMGHLALGHGLAEDDRHEEGIASLRTAVRMATELAASPDAYGEHLYLTSALRHANRLDEAVAAALAGRLELDAVGAGATGGASLLSSAADIEILRGNWDCADRLLVEADACDPGSYVAAALDLVRVRLAVLRGDLSGGRALLSRLDAVISLDTARPSTVARVLGLQAELAGWEGKFTVVRGLVDTALTRLAGTSAERRLGGLLVLGLWAEAELSVVAGRCEPGHADRIVAAVSKLCAEPEQQAHAALCHALAADVRRSPDPDSWSAAVSRWQGVGQPFVVAFARWRSAESLLGQSSSDRSALLLRDAHRSAQALGASALQAAIVRTAGRYRIPLAEVLPPPAASRAGLTARELEILSHLRAGRSNGEIAAVLVISPKTVSVHVTNILRKLNVSRRADAAKALDLLEADR